MKEGKTARRRGIKGTNANYTVKFCCVNSGENQARSPRGNTFFSFLIKQNIKSSVVHPTREENCKVMKKTKHSDERNENSIRKTQNVNETFEPFKRISGDRFLVLSGEVTVKSGAAIGSLRRAGGSPLRLRSSKPGGRTPCGLRDLVSDSDCA